MPPSTASTSFPLVVHFDVDQLAYQAVASVDLAGVWCWRRPIGVRRTASLTNNYNLQVTLAFTSFAIPSHNFFASFLI
jgi:hypothetical protein